MKKAIIIALLAVCLAAPFKASAFSFGDVISYGRKILKTADKKPAPPVLDEKSIDRSLPVDVRFDRKEKYRIWKESYSNEDITNLFKNPENFVFSEEELNYFSQKEYNTSSTTIVRDLKVDLKPGLIKISGYSLMNMMKGNFSAEIKVVKGVEGLYLKVSKARLGRLWIPSFALDNLIKRETKKLKQFLYSNKDYQNLEVLIDEDRLELKYKQ
jgi:hypothetical protein